jgi:hypothetical protein
LENGEMLNQHSRSNFREKPIKFAQNHEEKKLQAIKYFASNDISFTP